MERYHPRHGDGQELENKRRKSWGDIGSRKFKSND
jgi:hypothetical protein